MSGSPLSSAAAETASDAPASIPPPPLPARKSSGPLPHFFQVLNLENDDNARTLVGVFQEQIGLAEEIVKTREDLTEAEEALGKVEQARKEFVQERKRDEKKLDDKTRQALKKEKKNAERAARKRGFPVNGGLTVTSTNVLTFVEAQASLASVSGPKDICRVVDIIKNEGTLVSDTGRYFHTGPIRNETTFQLLCGLAFREVSEARDKVTALEKRATELDAMADTGHLALMDSVRKRYKVLAIRMHPDKLPRTPTDEDYQRFRELQTAHQVLSDTELRRRYIQMMDHTAFLATLPKSIKDADQEGVRPVIKRDHTNGRLPQPTRTAQPNEARRLTGGFPHRCSMPRVVDVILSDPKRGHSRVMLSWSCASAEELQISRYELHVKQKAAAPDGVEWVRIYLGWSTEWWTDVLPPGYHAFRVRAENNLGLGEWSTILDHYVEDVQLVRQQRREEVERNKEERRVKLAKRLRRQITHVLNQPGNIPTTEKLSRLRKLLDQAQRSRMGEIALETQDIVMEMEARVLKNEEQHIWKSRLNEYVKAVMNEDGNGRVPSEDGTQPAPDDDGTEGGDEPDLEDSAKESGEGAPSDGKSAANASSDTVQEISPAARAAEHEEDPDVFDTSTDMEDFLTSLPSMYPADSAYVLPHTIRNQIVQTVQALFRNRPTLRIAAVVPDTNDPAEIEVTVANEIIYHRLMVICDAALLQKEYLGSQAGFREIQSAIRILGEEIDDAGKAAEKKHTQIESFLQERERGMQARVEADRLARERVTRTACVATSEGSPSASAISATTAQKSSDAVSSKSRAAHKDMEEPPPPYTPREYDESGVEIDPDDDRDNNFEFVGTPRLRRRGTRGGTRRRKASDVGSAPSSAVLSAPCASTSAPKPAQHALSPPQQTQTTAISPRNHRRGNRVRSRKDTQAPASEDPARPTADKVTPRKPNHGTSTSSATTARSVASTAGVSDHSAGTTPKVSEHAASSASAESTVASPWKREGDDQRVSDFLETSGFQQLVQAFAEHGITYSDLPLLRESDLVQIGLTKVGPRKRLMHLMREQTSDDNDVVETATASVSTDHWLRKLGLDRYADAFATEEIGFDDLKTLTEGDLVNTLGIQRLGDLARMVNALDVLNAVPSKIKPASPAKKVEKAVVEDTPVEEAVENTEPVEDADGSSPDPLAFVARDLATESAPPPLDDVEKYKDTYGKHMAASISGLGILPYPFADEISSLRSSGGFAPGGTNAAAVASAADAYGSQMGDSTGTNSSTSPSASVAPGLAGTNNPWNEQQAWQQQQQHQQRNMAAFEPYSPFAGGAPYGTYPGAARVGRNPMLPYDQDPLLMPHLPIIPPNAYPHGAASTMYRPQLHDIHQQHHQIQQQQPPQQQSSLQFHQAQHQQQQQQGLHQSLHQGGFPGASLTQRGGGVGGGGYDPSDGMAGLGGALRQQQQNESSSSSAVPPEFICALTRRVITVPVRGPDGYYYDHAPLRARLISDNSWRSPVTLMYHPVETWHRALNSPDMVLKAAIDAWLLKQRQRRGSVGALNAARDLWDGSSNAFSDDAPSSSSIPTGANNAVNAARSTVTSPPRPSATSAAGQPASNAAGGANHVDPSAPVSAATIAAAVAAAVSAKPTDLHMQQLMQQHQQHQQQQQQQHGANVSVPASQGGLKATMGLSGWTADVPGGASIWR
ncbi:hypothetical protein HKX48_008765 [Thoreauomyces humboldtii]|nr:hypothetical protein HKX48_008765 [Thoreauomyces humboldtii]